MKENAMGLGLKLSVFIMVSFFLSLGGAGAIDLKPVGGITAFGGAERASGNSATGIGGADAFGLWPIARNVGIQGGLSASGGQGFRLGVNAGPVLNFDSGKLGVFADYEYRAREDFNYAVHSRHRRLLLQSI
jgi:hypothetical protein